MEPETTEFLVRGLYRIAHREGRLLDVVDEIVAVFRCV